MSNCGDYCTFSSADAFVEIDAGTADLVHNTGVASGYDEIFRINKDASVQD